MADARLPGFRMWVDGTRLESAQSWVRQLEVTECVDGATTFRLVLDLSPIDGSWDHLDPTLTGRAAEARTEQLATLPNLGLYHRVTIELSQGTDDDGHTVDPAVVCDGYITDVTVELGPDRSPDSRMVLDGIDASGLMHLQTVTRSWQDLSDADIAREVFSRYGFATTDDSVDDTAPVRDLDRSTIIQRGTDAEFLRMLARRNGFEVYVESTGDEPTEGSMNPGDSVVGHFRAPRPDASVQGTLTLFPRATASLVELQASWSAHAPTRIRGWHIDERTRRIQRADITEPEAYDHATEYTRAAILAERFEQILPEGLPAVVEPGSTAADRSAATLEVSDLDSAFVPHAEPETANLARAVFREADWFVQATGTVRGSRYSGIVRPRRPIELTGASEILDGSWYVRRVRHRWGVDRDEPDEEPELREYQADLELVRNTLGGPA